MRDQIFISYSHLDRRWLKRLQVHLKPFKRNNQIQVWDDTEINAGDLWREKIDKALQSAKVAVLLVSPNFLASDYITQRELPVLLEAAKTEELKIIWIAVSDSAYTETEIQHFQAANRPERPLDTLKSWDRNRQLVKICKLIKSEMNPECRLTQLVDSMNLLKTLPTTLDGARSRMSFGLSRLVLIGVVLAVLSMGSMLVYSRFRHEPPSLPPARPLTTAEFDDNFDNPGHWQVPASGWTIKDGEMFIENQTELGFVPEKNYGDLEMGFHLTLDNPKGAAWAVHVQPNGRDYYLFYLSGPEGQIPNRFITYIVRNNKVTPTLFQQSVALTENLEVDGQYQITVRVNGNHITHSIESAQTGGTFNLGDFTDEDNTFVSGTVGFRTIADEKFLVDELYVRPLNIKPSQ